eukprot:scaffold343_cov584-Prasinococcus_capsulatus_cf.AAC.5
MVPLGCKGTTSVGVLYEMLTVGHELRQCHRNLLQPVGIEAAVLRNEVLTAIRGAHRHRVLLLGLPLLQILRVLPIVFMAQEGANEGVTSTRRSTNQAGQQIDGKPYDTNTHDDHVKANCAVKHRQRTHHRSQLGRVGAVPEGEITPIHLLFTSCLTCKRITQKYRCVLGFAILFSDEAIILGLRAQQELYGTKDHSHSNKPPSCQRIG